MKGDGQKWWFWTQAGRSLWKRCKRKGRGSKFWRKNGCKNRKDPAMYSKYWWWTKSGRRLWKQCKTNGRKSGFWKSNNCSSGRRYHRKARRYKSSYKKYSLMLRDGQKWWFWTSAGRRLWRQCKKKGRGSRFWKRNHCGLHKKPAHGTEWWWFTKKGRRTWKQCKAKGKGSRFWRKNNCSAAKRYRRAAKKYRKQQLNGRLSRKQRIKAMKADGQKWWYWTKAGRKLWRQCKKKGRGSRFWKRNHCGLRKKHSRYSKYWWWTKKGRRLWKKCKKSGKKSAFWKNNNCAAGRRYRRNARRYKRSYKKFKTMLRDGQKWWFWTKSGRKLWRRCKKKGSGSRFWRKKHCSLRNKPATYSKFWWWTKKGRRLWKKCKSKGNKSRFWRSNSCAAAERFRAKAKKYQTKRKNERARKRRVKAIKADGQKWWFWTKSGRKLWLRCKEKGRASRFWKRNLCSTRKHPAHYSKFWWWTKAGRGLWKRCKKHGKNSRFWRKHNCGSGRRYHAKARRYKRSYKKFRAMLRGGGQKWWYWTKAGRKLWRQCKKKGRGSRFWKRNHCGLRKKHSRYSKYWWWTKKGRRLWKQCKAKGKGSRFWKKNKCSSGKRFHRKANSYISKRRINAAKNGPKLNRKQRNKAILSEGQKFWFWTAAGRKLWKRCKQHGRGSRFWRKNMCGDRDQPERYSKFWWWTKEGRRLWKRCKKHGRGSRFWRRKNCSSGRRFHKKARSYKRSYKKYTAMLSDGQKWWYWTKAGRKLWRQCKKKGRGSRFWRRNHCGLRKKPSAGSKWWWWTSEGRETWKKCQAKGRRSRFWRRHSCSQGR